MVKEINQPNKTSTEGEKQTRVSSGEISSKSNNKSNGESYGKSNSNGKSNSRSNGDIVVDPVKMGVNFTGCIANYNGKINKSTSKSTNTQKGH